MNIVLIIPTGIGAEIGGHAGDGNPVAKLIGSVSNHLITHPNVVNASDINEMPENTLYVEGSMLDRFLEGKIELEKVYRNKILLVVNEMNNNVVNSVSAARATIGADIEIMILDKPLEMVATMKNGIASGYVHGHVELIEQVKNCKFDALALATPITVEKGVAKAYLENHGGVNPWGGIEAITSKIISGSLKKPVAHSPVDEQDTDVYKEMMEAGITDPRAAAELVSVSYLHCILKGLHKAPRIGKGLSVKDVDLMISPYGCYGRPHQACQKAGIPIIVVKENKTCLNDKYPEDHTCIFVDNYLEAVGVIQSIKAGVSLESLRRPLKGTIIHNSGEKNVG